MAKVSFQNLPVTSIYRNPDQPRKRFDTASLDELAESIKTHGLIQPIVVEHIPAVAGEYMIVAGERRWRAHKIAGLKTIRAIIQENTNHNGRERLLAGVIENIQREDMNAIDEAEGFRDLLAAGLAIHELSQAIGKSVTHIYNALKRLRLPPEVRELMRQGKLSADLRVVAALLSLKDSKVQIGLAQRASDRGLKIVGIMRAAKQLNDALAGDRMKNVRQTKSPAMKTARKKYSQDFDDETPPNKWNALVQVGKAPSWEAVVKAANGTCEACELRSMANDATCRNCPAVDMLGHLARQAEEKK